MPDERQPREPREVRLAKDVADAYAELPDEKKRQVIAVLEQAAATPDVLSAAEVAAGYESLPVPQQVRVSQIIRRAAVRAERG